jgi:hypothetical protein
LPRFGVALVAGWTAQEAAHVAGCPYCQKVGQMFAAPEQAPAPGQTGRSAPTPGHPEPAAADTRLPPGKDVGFTTLARDGGAEALRSLRERLRPFLPFLLECVGLDHSRADAFLDFALSRTEEVRRHRFRELLPGWLREFAGGGREAPAVREEDLERAAGRAAVVLVLDRVGPDEPAWARDFRDLARARRPQKPWELRTLEVTGPLAGEPDLPIFRRSLAAQAEQLQRRELAALLE